jgi:hypothetical protein
LTTTDSTGFGVLILGLRPTVAFFGYQSTVSQWVAQ